MPVIDLPAATPLPNPQLRHAQIDVSHLATALDYGPKTTTTTELGVNLVKAQGNNLHSSSPGMVYGSGCQMPSELCNGA